MSLTREQVDALLQPIAGARVSKKDNQSHVEAYDIRRRLTNIFGFGGWGEDSSTELIYETFDGITVGRDEKPGVEVGYKARCVLTVYGIGPAGRDAVFAEEAFGGQRMGVKSRGDCHDFAVKTAESQAFKRAAVNLGDQFGLSLYNGGSLAPLVVYVLGEDMAKWTPDGVVRPERGQQQSQQGEVDVTDHVTEPLAAEDPAPEGEAPPVADPPVQAGTAPAVGGAPPSEPDPLPQDMLREEVDAIMADDTLTAQQRKAKLTKVLMRANEAGVKGAMVGDGRKAQALDAYITAAVARVGR